MDKDWFKTRLRSAGKTTQNLADAISRDRAVVSRILNGKQPMTIEQAEIFAECLNQPIDQVVLYAGLTQKRETAHAIAPGYSDGDVVQFSGTGSSAHEAMERAKLFGGSKPGVDLWTVTSTSMALGGYLPGDHIVVDSHQSGTCKAGDIVLAQVYNWKDGLKINILRRFEPPVLVSTCPNPSDDGVHVLDGKNVSLLGKVIASWRA